MLRIIMAACTLASPGMAPVESHAPLYSILHSILQDTTTATRKRDSTAVQRDSIQRDSVRPGRLQAVTVTATRARRDDPRSTTTVSAATIRETPATSPWDLLRQTAGVEVHVAGQGPGFASDASIRGFSSDHSTDLALWIDGVPINEPVNGHAEGYGDWSLIFPQAVQSIDVIKGPTSALFGNFALSGIVNVHTVERTRGTEVWLSGSSPGRVEGSVLTGFDRGATGSGVLGFRAEHDRGWRPNSRYDLGQGHLRLVHDVTRSATLDVGAELYGTQWDSPGYLSEDQFARREYDIVSNPSDGGHKYRGQERASLRVSSGPRVWRTTVYATQGTWRLFLTIPPAGGRFEGTGSQTEEDDDRYGVGATSALTWALPRGDITIGTEGRWDHSHYQNYFTTDRSRDSSALLVTARQLSGAAFIQSNWRILDRLRLNAGVRYDVLDTRADPRDGTVTADTHGIIAPKLGALFQLTHSLGLYANASRGFRSTDGVISDPSLPLITVWAYESGIKFDRGTVSASAALFDMDVSNEQTFNPLTTGSSNGGASRRRGLELTLRTPVAPALTLSSDWTFTDARYTRLIVQGEDPAVVDTLSGFRVYNTARYVGVASLDLAPASAPWSVRVSGNAVGPYSPFDEPGVVLPAYRLLYVSGLVHVGDATVELGIRNLLDRRYPELVAGHIVSPGQPRSVSASVRYAF